MGMRTMKEMADEGARQDGKATSERQMCGPSIVKWQTGGDRIEYFQVHTEKIPWNN